MNEIIEKLEAWRESRGMNDKRFNLIVEVSSMMEECIEVLRAESNQHKAEEVCDVAIFALNALSYIGAEFKPKQTHYNDLPSIMRALANMLEYTSTRTSADELCYIIRSCDGFVTNLGYNFEKLMLEKIAVISSRKQDPIQAALWRSNVKRDEKWKKDKNQDPKTIHEIDFAGCRVKR